MKVLFLTRYGNAGPSSRYRFYNYQSYFDEAEMNYCFKPLLENDYISNLYRNQKVRAFVKSFFSIFKRMLYLILNMKKYDLVIIEKELFPNVPYFIESLFLKSRPYALDFDDYIAASYIENKYKRFFFKNKIQRLVAKAKFVTVGNHWYYEEFKSNNLKYLPTVVDVKKYSKAKQYNKGNIVTIVWIGSPSTVKYLQIVAPILQDLAQKHPIKLKVIGASIVIDGVDVELVKWDSQTEADELLTSDIGIMPLRRTMWENGKCGFKLIQYMASGLPVVATSAPANNEIIKDGINGFIIHEDAEWYNKLEALIVNSSQREEFGRSGKVWITSDYSYQIWGSKYVNIIKNA